MVDARVLYAVKVRSTQHKKNKFAIPADLKGTSNVKLMTKFSRPAYLFATEELNTDNSFKFSKNN